MEKRYATASQPLKTFFRMFSYLKYHKALTVLVIAFAFLNTGISLFGTFLLKPVIDDYVVPAVEGIISLNQLKKSLLTLLIGLFALFTFSFVLALLQTLLMIKLSQLSINKMRENLFDKLQDLPLEFFDKSNAGEIMSSFTNDLNLVNEAFTNSFLEILTSSVLVCGIMVMLFITNWLLALIVLFLLPFMLLLVKKFAKLAHKNFDATQKSLGEMNGYIEEMFSSQKVIKAFNKENDVEKKFNVILERMTKEAIDSSFYSNVGIPVVKNYSTILLITCTIVGSLLSFVFKVSWLPMTTGTLAVFLTLINQLYRPLNRTTNQLNIVQAALAGAERVFNIMDQPVEYKDETQYKVLEVEDKYYWVLGENKKLVNGEVKFLNVDFAYNANENVLKNISFIVKPGQKVSLVGKTGSGKTTITNLITKFYKVKRGCIFIDDIDINDIDYKSLRKMISLVLQNTDLFSQTIINNIRFGRLKSTDEECIKAAKLSRADEFIMKLKDGYNTYISGNNSSISAGQKQLLAISRVAVSNAPIMILDEATSSIDTRTEKLINCAMDEVMKGKTVFVIAHRLSTVKNSDLILVIENGVIIESGTHEELFEKKGKYHSLCHKQEIDQLD